MVRSNYTLNEIKEKIVYYREEKNMTYEDIATTLNEFVGYKKYTRQSIFGLYKRYLKSIQYEGTLGLEVFDILNIYVRVRTVAGVQEEITKLNMEFTNYAVGQLIKEHDNIIEVLNNDLVDIIYDCIKAGDEPSEILERVKYKGVSCKDKVYEDLFFEAYKRKMTEDIEKMVFETKNYIENNKKIGASLLKDFNIEKSITVVMNQYKNQKSFTSSIE